ncbi:MAG: hypothetical protein HY393_01315 [Candidatus Diapherotrites archaeon]|nr:hypothetical protein [Candidatus Diapherotrites archaeon]
MTTKNNNLFEHVNKVMHAQFKRSPAFIPWAYHVLLRGVGAGTIVILVLTVWTMVVQLT